MSQIATTRDLDRTKADILQAATEEFTRLGYFGARVDGIAAATSTTKRMIYYCFGSKDGLFRACLQAALGGIRAYEQEMHLADLPPREAIAAYVKGTILYHEAHPEVARLVREENIVGAMHVDDQDQPANRPIVVTLEEVLARGRESGELRSDVTAIQVHVAVTSLSNFRITNAATIESIFGHDMRDPERLESDLGHFVDMILGWLTRQPS
ncbi:MAG: TetR family transcriptional regulator [bacterium]|nr:TetR family transcriptional regulator [bacterium]